MKDSEVDYGVGLCCCISVCLFFLLTASLTTTYANKYEQESGLAKGVAEWITWAIFILFGVVFGCVLLSLRSIVEIGFCIIAVCGVYCFILLEIFLLICGVLVSVSVSRNENLSSTGKGVGISAAVFIFCGMFLALLGPFGLLKYIMGDRKSGGGGGGGGGDDGGDDDGGGVTFRSYQPRASSDHSLTEDQKRQFQAYLNSLTQEQQKVIFEYMLAESRGENPTAPEGMTEEQLQIIIVIANTMST